MVIQKSKKGPSTGHQRTKEYRGGYFASPDKEIYLSLGKNLILNPKDPVDAGMLSFYQNSGRTPVPLQDNSKYSVKFKIGEINLSEVLRMKKQNLENKILEDLDIEQYLPAAGVGIVPLGKGPIVYTEPQAFKDDFVKSFIEFIEGFKEENFDLTEEEKLILRDDYKAFKSSEEWTQGLVEQRGEDWAPFLEQGLEQEGLARVYFNNPKNITRFMETYASFLSERAAKLFPTVDSIRNQTSKHVGLSSLVDSLVSSFGHNGKEWKSQGFLYVLQDKKGSQQLYYADPFSTNGSEVHIVGRSESEVIPEIKKQMEFDKKDTLVRNAGNGKMEDYIKINSTAISVDMKRKTESPITHVPVLDLSNPNSVAIINVGLIDPETDKRESHMMLRIGK